MKVVIEFVRGTDEEIEDVERWDLGENQLHLYACVPGGNDGYNYWPATEKHLGSYPLCNIKKWQRIDD